MILDFIFEFARQFQAASDSITAVAAVFAAIFAYIGLRAWRLQLKGASEYALAKELLKAVYRVREAFKQVRNPAIFSYEYPKSMRTESGHLQKEFEAEGTAHVYEERFKILDEAFRTLEDRNLDGQVEWGFEYAEVIIPLRKCRTELLITLREHIDSFKPGYERRRTTQAEKRVERSVMYYVGDDRSDIDCFTPEINAAVALFERRLRPIIGKKKGQQAGA